MAGTSNLDDPDLAHLQSSFDEQQAKITALRAIIRQTEVVNDMKHATAQEKVKNIAQRLTHFKTKVTTSRLNRAGSTGLSASSTALNVSTGVGPPPELRQDARGVAFQRGRSESSGMEKCSLLRQQIEQNRLKMAERESSQREIEEKVIDLRHKLEATQQTLGRSTTDLDVSGMRDEPRRYGAFLCSTPAEPCQQPAPGAPDDDRFDEELTRFEHVVRQAQAKRSADEAAERRIATLEDSLHRQETIIDGQLRALAALVNDLLDGRCRAGPLLVPDIHRMQMKLLQQSYNISSDEAASRLRDSYGYDPLEKAEEYSEAPSGTAKPAVCATPADESSAQQLQEAQEKIASLEQALAVQDAETERLNQQLTDLRQTLEEKTIELNVMTANVSVLQEKLKTSGPKPLFPRTADEELESETTKLKQQLDESNKNMIKCKLKIKQLQKQVDTFKQTSSVHEQVARLTEEIGVLTAQRPADGSDEPSVTPHASELQKRIETLERTCQNQATAMQLLEEQKNDLSEDLCRTRHELQSLNEHVTVTDGGENGRIASQMLSIELEEKLEQCLADKSELARVQHGWEAERAELQRQLQRYADENAELVGRIDKLSLEKVSSAESIEILENLTLREKQEMEGTEKATGEPVEAPPTVDDTLTREDLNESLLKLMEESKELMDKVELFTDERREVLEKLDAISIENRAYVCELDKLKEANEQLRTYSVELATAKTELEDRLRTIDDEKHAILGTAKLRGPVPATGDGDGEVSDTFDADVYQQSLQALEAETANYGKSKDKQKKMQIAKKLTVSVKSVVTMSRQLLDEYGRAATQRAQPVTLPDDAASDTSAAAVAAATISTLETKLTETTKCLEGKASEVGLLQEQVARLRHELQVAADEKCSDDEPELLKVELNSKNDEIALLRKDIDALVDAKSAELLQFQQRLLDAQKETRQLMVIVADLEAELELARTVSSTPVDSDELQHKQETIETLNAQIIELYRTLEAHQAELDEVRTQREQVEQKNEELLEKLKKFAANLKKKNAQCTELEKDVARLTVEANRPVAEATAPAPAPDSCCDALREENEQLAQKLHHLNNELHRLLEQKYQLESERETTQGELGRCAEQLTVAQHELEGRSAELHAAQEELTGKGVKIEKCKAIIKEKIKETQRLQERERRAAYLEDELRMTQSKLEDFHNQTLLLGRLKSEKEEMNASARQEHEQREALQRDLDRAAAWVRRYCSKWSSRDELRQATPEPLEPPPPTTEPSMAWLAQLAATDRVMSETLAHRADELQECDERSRTLQTELSRVRMELVEASGEQERTIERLHDELSETQEELLQLNVQLVAAGSETQQQRDLLHEYERTLEQMRSAKAQVEQHEQNELNALRYECNRLRKLVDDCEETIAQLKSERQQQDERNAQLTEELGEIGALRENLATLERALGEERARLQELSAANDALRTDVEQLRVQLREEQAVTAQCRQQVMEEKQQKDQLNEALRRQELEVESLRGECEQLRVLQNEQLNEALRQRDLEMEALRAQHNEQWNETLRQKEREVETLRTQQSEQLNEAVRQQELEVAKLRGDAQQLREALEQRELEVESLRLQHSEQLQQVMRQKALELESLCTQRDEALRQSELEVETLRTQQIDQLNSALRQSELEVETLRGDADQLREALEQSSLEVESLRLQHSEQLQEVVRQKDLELESLCTQRKHQLDEALRQSELEVETLRTQQIDQLNSVIRQKEQEAVTLRGDADRLREALEQRELEVESLRMQQTDQLNQALRQKELELEQVRGKCEQQLAEVERVRTDLQASLDRLGAEHAEQSREVAQLRETVARFEQQTQQDRTNLSILNSLNGALNEDLDLQQQHAGVAEQRYQSLLEQYEQGKQELERAQANHREETARVEELTVALRAKEQECAALKSAPEQQQQQQQCALDMWDDGDSGWGTSGNTAALEATVREQEDQIRQLDTEKALMQQEITDLKVKSGKLLRKLKECMVKLEAATAGGQQAGSTPNPDAQPERQQALEARLREVEQEHAALKRTKDALDVKLDILEAACDKLTDEKEEQDRQNAELREKVRQSTAARLERETEVAHLNARLAQLTGELEAAGELRAQLAELQEQNARLQAPVEGRQPTADTPATATHSVELQLAELEHTNRQLAEERAEMGRELEVLNQQILHDLQFEDRLNTALLELDAKGVEVQMLRATLDQLQQGGVGVPDAPGPLEARGQTLEQERAPGAPDAHIQAVLERQELEIVTLKEQLAVRSAEYARLAARVDPTKLFAAGLGTTAEPVAPPKAPEQQPGDRVPRAELELALYMIYQRDMRCDELELELRNLLQERDTLQLRLSNALRTHEELKLRCAGPAAPDHEYGTSGECSIDASPDRSLSGLAAAAAVDERPVSSLSGPQDLNSKLSELHSISYSKEKRWQEEREDRNRQLTLIQRDLANMPVEAAAKIAGTEVPADTEAATQQSASTVLLNWLLGKK
uniref:Uncharacterized protein n=1 Tax=Anopheles dirus TaxID=7168 RepID=A0A182N0V4_9DIPT